MNNKTTARSTDRGAAKRAQQRMQDDALRTLAPYGSVPASSRSLPATNRQKDSIKVSFIGGLADVGEKNMAVIEYADEAVVLDCGNSLGTELPGVNCIINDPAYLDEIAHKIKGYVITHGHLDHIGGLRHTLPKFPAPVYGSRYTIGLIEKMFEDRASETGEVFSPQLVTAPLDTHELFRISDNFRVEFVRVTHALPDAAAVAIETPVGRIVATGDFRLDPEPLDSRPTDTTRLRELGAQGVLLLLSDSSYADVEGRVPTESTLQQSFHDIIGRASGRIFVAAFSSNMNRTQMIINAAVAAGRKVALDGRGMLSYAEIAVRQGILKVPKDTIISIKQVSTISPEKVLVMCTGGQGEPNAALQRMSEGRHKHVNLSAGDTVVISSSPIPGNEVSYDMLSNRLKKTGVHLFRHPTHEVDGCGPLHVSGHARRDELREMLQMTRPKYFIPVHGGTLRRSYHAELGVEEGVPRVNVLVPENGDSVRIDAKAMVSGGTVAHGALLVDQNDSVVSGLVVKDRIMLAQVGIMSIILTIDAATGQLVSSPDIISRGYINVKESAPLMNKLRFECRRLVAQRKPHGDIDDFKSDIRDAVAQFLHAHTGSSPIVIPVVNVVGTARRESARPHPAPAKALARRRVKPSDQLARQA